jgi:phosphoribosylformylglycinamidine synthase PurS subunit
MAVEKHFARIPMLLRVYVTLKPSVLDPQGMTLQKAMATLGHARVTQVRQGKYFEIQWQGDLSTDAERSEVEAIAAQILSNPVIEDFRVEWPGEARR